MLPSLLRGAAPTAASPALLSRVDLLFGVAVALAAPGPAVLGLGAFVGAAYAGPWGALVGAAAVHLPGLLALCAALPFWVQLRSSPRVKMATRALHAASSGLVVAAALALFDMARAPSQHAIALLAFAAHDGWAAAAPRLASQYHPPLIVATGAALGVPLCMPSLQSRVPLSTSLALDGVAGAASSSSARSASPLTAHGGWGHAPGASIPSTEQAATRSPPPPAPEPPDPSPPPPPRPEPPAHS